MYEHCAQGKQISAHSVHMQYIHLHVHVHVYIADWLPTWPILQPSSWTV